MKIYRGPSQKHFSDDTHQKVSEVDLSKDVSPWVDRRRFRGNITKDGYERRAVTHVELEADDIIALHQGLVEGLKQQAAQSKSFQKALEEIYRASVLAAPHGDAEAIKKIKERAASVLNPVKKSS